MSILGDVDGLNGYYLGLSFTSSELTDVRNCVRTAWLANIKSVAPNLINEFENLQMTDYHTKAHLLDHDSIWPKRKRILNMGVVDLIKNTSLFQKLEAQLGEVTVSGEDGVEPQEIYWRLVRPNSPNDVGPLHADEWFWRIGNWYTPEGYRRLKIWISLFSEKGKNGFKYVPGSHKKEWDFGQAEKSGLIKPVIREDENSLNAIFFESNPGDAIVFHDKLLHGGSIGGEKTRVSMEWTMFVKA